MTRPWECPYQGAFLGLLLANPLVVAAEPEEVPAVPLGEGKLVPADMRQLVEVQAESEEDEPVADDGELVGEEDAYWLVAG